KLANTVVMTPVNDKYRPDPKRGACTCPVFVRTRPLICKHLVQAVQPVPPIFFLQVKRNRTLPFWEHPTLIPLNTTPDNMSTTQIPSEHKDHQAEDIETSDANASDDDEDEGEADMVDTMAGRGVATGGPSERP